MFSRRKKFRCKEAKKSYSYYKRPGADFFLSTLATRYEVIIYTEDPATFAKIGMNTVDPYQKFATYFLYGDNLGGVGNSKLLDPKRLNRDLSKTVILDPKPWVLPLFPSSFICVPKWIPFTNDDVLYELTHFFDFVGREEGFNFSQFLSFCRTEKYNPFETFEEFTNTDELLTIAADTAWTNRVDSSLEMDHPFPRHKYRPRTLKRMLLCMDVFIEFMNYINYGDRPLKFFFPYEYDDPDITWRDLINFHDPSIDEEPSEEEMEIYRTWTKVRGPEKS